MQSYPQPAEPALRFPRPHHRKEMFCLVPRAGLEPARPCGLRILSPLRLPFHHRGNLLLYRSKLYRMSFLFSSIICGAQGGTRTRTTFRSQPPQGCVSAIPPPGQVICQPVSRPCFGALRGTRTHTPFPGLAPEASASTNSARRALIILHLIWCPGWDSNPHDLSAFGV